MATLEGACSPALAGCLAHETTLRVSKGLTAGARCSLSEKAKSDGVWSRTWKDFGHTTRTRRKLCNHTATRRS